ncbi:MAG: MerR family transcriptional regulator [Actinobacteria bacterium]|nr:MerR family transcriptional regulator [Actinomycetota bacterium]
MGTDVAEATLRVEDLARAADVSVDTIRFYQKRRLLPPPTRRGRIAWYGPEHTERLARIRDLQQRGFSLALIRRLLDGELDAADVPLAAAVATAAAGADDPDDAVDTALLTLDDVAAGAGVPAPLLDAVVRAGVLVPRVVDGEERFAPADVDLVRGGLALLEAGFPLADLLSLAGRHDAATHAIAEDAVRLFDEHVREPLRAQPLTDDERAERLVAAFRTLLPTITTLVAHHFRRVLLEVAQTHLEQVGEATELAAASAEPGWGAA